MHNVWLAGSQRFLRNLAVIAGTTRHRFLILRGVLTCLCHFQPLLCWLLFLRDACSIDDFVMSTLMLGIVALAFFAIPELHDMNGVGTDGSVKLVLVTKNILVRLFRLI